MNKIFKLYSNCVPVTGKSRTIIYDLQRDRLFALKNEIFFQIEAERLENNDIVNEFIDHLILNEFGHIIENDDMNLFPAMNLDWDYPSTVTNAIIHFNESIAEYLKGLIPQFYLLNVKCVEFRILDQNLVTNFVEYLSLIKHNIEIVVSINITSRRQLDPLLNDHKVSRIHAFNLHEEQLENSEDSKLVIHHGILSDSSCGAVNLSNFNFNMIHFTESQKHNTCLNRKISVDAEGNIKNCPSMPKSYGNIRSMTFSDVINNNDFQKYWNITKEQITGCKECEFRHICTDCRAYVEDPMDDLSKPLKCGYNPHTCQWEAWSTNPLKQRAIEYYSMPNDIPHRENA